MDKDEFLKQWRQEYVYLFQKGNMTLSEAAKNDDFKKEWKAYPNKKKLKVTKEQVKKEKKEKEARKKVIKQELMKYEQKQDEFYAAKEAEKEKEEMEYKQRRKKENEEAAEAAAKEDAVNRARMIKWVKMLKTLDKTTVKIPTKESTPTTTIIVAVIEEHLFDPEADQFERLPDSYYGLLVNGQVVVLGRLSFVVYQGDNMKDGAEWMLKTFPRLTYFQNNKNHINYDSASYYEKFGFDYFGPPPEEVNKLFLVKR